MDIRPLPPEEAPVRRYVEDLWVPYHRELEATVESHALADGVDLLAEETAFRLERLADEDVRAWVAVDRDGGTDGGDLTDESATFAGFVTAELDRSPPVFDRPDRMVVGDIYVRGPYRGSGLAESLVGRVADHARETDCPELALDVDADNDRALAFYDRLGFARYRHRMVVAVDDL